MGGQPVDEVQAVIDEIRATSLDLNVLGRAFAEENGLHRTDADALGLIMDADAAGAAMGPTQLARQLDITTASTTVLIDRLVKAGHLERRPDKLDRRRLVLAITDSARTAGRTFFGRFNQELREDLSVLSDDELAAARRLLRIVRARIAEHERDR